MSCIRLASVRCVAYVAGLKLRLCLCQGAMNAGYYSFSMGWWRDLKGRKGRGGKGALNWAGRVLHLCIWYSWCNTKATFDCDRSAASRLSSRVYSWHDGRDRRRTSSSWLESYEYVTLSRARTKV